MSLARWYPTRTSMAPVEAKHAPPLSSSSCRNCYKGLKDAGHPSRFGIAADMQLQVDAG
jgi:hypothetical protein